MRSVGTNTEEIEESVQVINNLPKSLERAARPGERPNALNMTAAGSAEGRKPQLQQQQQNVDQIVESNKEGSILRSNG